MENDRDIAQYVFRWFRNLMTPLEKRAANHLYATMKAAPLKSHIEAQSEEEKTAGRYRFFTDPISDDADVLRLTEGGFEGFIERTSARILDESRHLISFNRCPKCGGLARTPTARQCRYCAHEWRAEN
jgi:hypothetical protein